MKKISLLLSLFLLVFCNPAKVGAQCTEPPTPKVLLVGDSWAWFMNTGGTINAVFDTWGYSNYTFVSNSVISENGAQTDDFMKADKQAEILDQLTINPSIEVVHLSIGGNDFLGDWHVSFSQAQTDSLTNNVFGRLDSVIRFIKTCRPDVKIFWSGYVYPNFGEVLNDFFNPSSHPFYGTWHDMGDPTFIQLNSLLNEISDQFDSIYANDPRVEFVPCTGLMQYLYGQTTQMSVPPSGTYAAFTQPLPYGDPNFPSPKPALNDYGFTKDCYHLAPNAYKAFFAYHTQKFYHKYLMDDFFALSENNSQTGSVSSQGALSDSLVIGESAGEQFAAVLSFNTAGMADTTLAKASLFLRRKGLTGSNAATGTFEVKIKSGNLGTTVNVEAADFSASADASGNACKFGSFAANGDWVRLDLPVQALQHINKAGTTQFVVSIPGANGGKVTYYNSTDPDFAPVLNLKYGETPSAIGEVASNIAISVYPNPANGLVTINAEGEVLSTEVRNTLGQVVLTPAVKQNTVDVSTLPTGAYVLYVNTAKGAGSQKIMVEKK
jgi:hypothetical protein